MKYLADILTFSRIVLSIALFFIAGLGGSPESAFIIFLVAELTDTFDGTCARKWPFKKGQEPKYRRYAAKYDMFADILLAGAQVLFVTLRINLIVGLIIIIYYLISSAGGDLWVYGRIIGHPDNCSKNSLLHRNFPLAKKFILTRRYIYVICLGIVNMMILFATSWPDLVKYSFVVLGFLIFVFAWFFLDQRRHNISRDAVDIEKHLSKQKSQK
ncbi:CDP-alcohol phosphatidyltransferase family protein [Candidatus Saccharibacteria bacterium]|nr:CDP-alcohol phosphatidyltransferase family protein [Candidatus Saccharibacteria bacterium]